MWNFHTSPVPSLILISHREKGTCDGFFTVTLVMRFLNRFPSLGRSVIKLLAVNGLPKFQIHTHLKPPKANQTLKRYLQSNNTSRVLLFFRLLLRENPSSIDSFSLLFVLKACTLTSSLVEGKQMHALAINFGFESIIFLQTSLINMYSVTGNVDDAHNMFDEIPSKNIICWTALIAAYVDNQKPNKALQLFRQMQMDDVQPDIVTVTVALSACADLGALDMGEWIRAYIRHRQELNTDLCLNNSLINMYSKCGDIGTARRLFEGMQKKDVTTWTSMIVGHALHGQAEEALKLFAKMKETNEGPRKSRSSGEHGNSLVLPSDVTFMGVLMACSHAGLVEEGKQHFRSMQEDYGLKPRVSHFGCMVDLLCRAGRLREAYNLILKMPMQPNAVVWRTLLGACSLQGDIEICSEARRHLLGLEPGHVGDDVVMSNIYAAKGMWDKKISVRTQIKQRRAPGCSSIEVESDINEFVAADDQHPCMPQICEVLEHLTQTMKTHGYELKKVTPWKCDRVLI